MTKQISLCNLLQTAFARPAFVPPRETNPPRLSRRWEQITSGLRLQADLDDAQREALTRLLHLISSPRNLM